MYQQAIPAARQLNERPPAALWAVQGRTEADLG